MQFNIIGLIIPSLSLIFACVFTGLWWRDRSRKYVLGFAVGYAALMGSSLISIIYAVTKAPVLLLTIHIISSVGAITIIWGAATRLRLSTPIIGMGVIAVVSSALLWIAGGLQNSNVIVNAQNGSVALLFALGAVLLWTARSKRLLDRTLVWIFGLLAAHGFIRPLAAMLSEGELSALIGGTSIFASINILVLLLLSVLLALVTALMVLSDHWQLERDTDAHDDLTGLYRRSAFESEVEVLAARAAKDNVALSMIIIDLDHFKVINDTHGHADGDRVLASFGALIKQQIRPSDVAGRLGGEEFCILAWDCDLSCAKSLAERIRILTEQGEGEIFDHGIPFTASFGAAQWESGENYAQVCKRADRGMYAAKGAGRNCVRLALGQSHKLASPNTGNSSENNVVSISA